MKVGRNDPCPCGSGKKYKRCCLESEVPDFEPGDDRAAIRESVISALSRFSKRLEFTDEREAAFQLFFGPRAADRDKLEILEDEDVKFFFFCIFDRVLEDGRTLAETFLERAAHRLKSREEQYLRRLAEARLRPYEVEEVVVDQRLRLRDLWSDESVLITERSATHQLTQWDLLAARVMHEEDGTLRIEGGIYLFPAQVKRPLLAALRKEERRLRRRYPDLKKDDWIKRCSLLFHHFWLEQVVFRPMPTIVTAEGDPMVFGKVTFEVTDAAALRVALDAHPDLCSSEDGSYVWVEDADEGFNRTLGHIELRGDRLTLEVTSRQRAQRGRRLLEEVAGSLLRHRATRFDSVEKALERARRKPQEESPPSIPAEAAAQVIGDFKERHYRTWPDEPLPALDGRTPRHAARLKTLRPRLIDLLKEMENHEARGARPDNPAYDFGRVWQELGLERPT